MYPKNIAHESAHVHMRRRIHEYEEEDTCIQ
jgi:hypothetical protein